MLTETLTAVSGHLNLDNILRIYGLLCLLTTPIGMLITAAWIKRNPDSASKMKKKINAVIKTENKSEPTIEAEKKEQEKNTEAVPQNNDEDYGITKMMLFVGDRYKCRLSEKEIKTISGGNFDWITDNEFVGKIEDNIFKAQKAGSTYVECGDVRMRIYHIMVESRRKNWYGYTAASDVLNKRNIDVIKCRENKRKTIRLDENEKVLFMRIPYGIAAYEYDNNKTVKRILLKCDISNEERQYTTSGLDELFGRLNTEKIPETYKYWYHMNGSDPDEGLPNSVDYLAMMHPTHDGLTYIGIGEAWRTGTGTKEYEDNIQMTDRSFAKLLDAEDIPYTVNIINKEETENKADKQQTTSPEKSEEKNNKTTQTTTPEKEDKENQQTETIKIQTEKKNVSIKEEKNPETEIKTETPTEEEKKEQETKNNKLPEKDDLPDTEDNEEDNESGYDDTNFEPDIFGERLINYEISEDNIDTNEVK